MCLETDMIGSTRLQENQLGLLKLSTEDLFILIKILYNAKEVLT